MYSTMIGRIFFVPQSCETSPVKQILHKHHSLFQEGLSKLTGFQGKLIIDAANS